MPLVVPGINSKPANKTEEWMNKLIGKTIKEEDHSTVNFHKKDLPEKHRIIAPGMVVTKDFVEDRLNVFVNEQGTVTHVSHG